MTRDGQTYALCSDWKLVQEVESLDLEFTDELPVLVRNLSEQIEED